MRMKNCACLCACVCVCARVYTCISVRDCVYVCAYVCLCARARAHVRARVCMCVRACSSSSSASETLDRYHEASANIMVNANNTCSFQEGKVGRKGFFCKQLAGV
jgi:hypothetical protein